MRRTLLLATMIALVLASCGKKKESDMAAADFEQEELGETLRNQLDSLAWEWEQTGAQVHDLLVGKCKLSEEEKKLKPTYLIDPRKADEMITLSQQYRAIAVFYIDKSIAAMYDMPANEYQNAISKLLVYMDSSAFEVFGEENDDMPFADMIHQFYEKEKEGGRIHLFWEAAAAATVEQMFILSQNMEPFLATIDNEAVCRLTKSVGAIKVSLANLAEYTPELESLYRIFMPIRALTAQNVEELREQLNDMKSDIETIRKKILE